MVSVERWHERALVDVITSLMQAYSRVNGPLVTETDPVLACPDRGADMIVAEIKQGYVGGRATHVVRMVMFAPRGERAPRGWHWVQLGHIFRFLDSYLRQQSALGRVDSHDRALAWLSLLHKCELSFSPERAST
jgi:hypothetical protein